MDEQQFQVCLSLIEQILSCAEGEEVAILQQQPDLVNEELLVVMQAYADWLEQQGNPNAGWLRQFAQRLTITLRDPNAQVERMLEDPEQFLLTVLQLIVNNQENAQQIYSVLEQHQDKLNPSLLQALPQVAAGLMASEPEQREFVAFNFYVFGNLLQQFPLGQRWLNLELAIAAYQQALTVVTLAEMPIAWAETMNSLAAAYYHRVQGERGKNVEQAIGFCQQALIVRTQTEMPSDWAITMNNLALAYSDRIQGDQVENIEQAIECHQQALIVRTQTEMPSDWAITMHNLAIAYSRRTQGDRTENIEQAIATFHQALTVRTRAEMPTDWAQTMNELANAYVKRIQGDRAENIERAIATFHQALIVRTQAEMPSDWAQTINDLANSYLDRIQGDRAENIEQAIATFHQALTVRIRAEMPLDWAQTMQNLATAYNKRIRGDRAENIEQAIEFYQQALTVRTQSEVPTSWALSIQNLATAYIDRIQGDQAENIEQAIEYYHQALRVRTQTTMPIDWAETINNLAKAYYSRIRGDQAENIEQAIKYYQKALRVRTQTTISVDLALTITNNLATAYIDRIRGDRAENIEQAIEYYQQILTVWTRAEMPLDWAKAMTNLAIAYYYRIKGYRAENIEQAIEYYQQALTVISRDKMSFEWAGIMNNLAGAYYQRIKEDRGKNIEQAIHAYQSCLEVFQPELLPNNCRRAARYLGNLYSEQKRWAEAVPIYQKALQASDTLYQSANLLDSKASELKKTGDLPRCAAYATARAGDLVSAATILEQGRARELSETLERDRSDLVHLQQIHPALFTRYQDITSQLRKLEAQQRLRMISEERHSLTPADFRTEALRLRQTLTVTIEQIRQIESYSNFLDQPSFDDIQQVVCPNAPLVYLVMTSLGSLSLIVTQSGIADLWLDELNETDLIDLLDNTWFSAYNQSRTNCKDWLDAINQVTHQLWKPLMAPLINHLKQHSFQQATLIPTGYLSLLPLHVAWVDDPTQPTGKRYALDTIQFSYIPNAQSLQAARAIADHTSADSLLVVGEPRPTTASKLPNSVHEVQTAIAAFPNHTLLHHEQATRSAMQELLPQHTVLHFSGHGFAQLDSPLDSGLVLANDEVLTLRDLFDLKLPGIRLAILSACETGLPGTQLPDEVVSLPTGLLQAGVAGVVASLWSVADISTMMLLVSFYNFWQEENLAPAAALCQAQQWLRDTTNGEKLAYFKGLMQDSSVSKIPASTIDYLYKSLILSRPDARDFAHPFHWAAFNYIGV